MKYRTERITNIKELETIIEKSMTTIQLLQKETKKENPSIKTINEFSEKLKDEYIKIRNFEFDIDVRDIDYCE